MADEKPVTPTPAPATEIKKPPAAKKPEPTGAERQLAVQRALTAEVKRTATAYKQMRSAEGEARDVQEELDLARFRNPHDRHSEFDRVDRKEPTLFEVAHYILFAPGLKQRSRNVPLKAIAEHGEDDDGPFALVECPCQSKPVVRATIEKCPGCERYYMLTAKRVIVVYGAMKPPGQPDDPASAADDEPHCAAGKCDGSGFMLDEETNTTWDCECRPGLVAARRKRGALVD